MGTEAEMRANLQALIAGPQLATPLDFAETLSRLALHYWRPDFAPGDAAKLNADYLHDLQGVTAEELKEACREWRTDPLNKFYPKVGELLELLGDKIAERKRIKVGAEYLLSVLDAPPEQDNRHDMQKRLHDLAEKMRAR